MSKEVLSTYAIYKNPLDFPGQFVARRFEVSARQAVRTDDYYAADTLEEVRAWIREFSIRRRMLADVRLPRSPNDDPCIVESWM